MLGGICGICDDCMTMPPPPLYPLIAGDVDVGPVATLSLFAGGSTLKPGGGLAMPDDETPVAFDVVETPETPLAETRVELLFLAVIFGC